MQMLVSHQRALHTVGDQDVMGLFNWIIHYSTDEKLRKKNVEVRTLHQYKHICNIMLVIQLRQSKRSLRLHVPWANSMRLDALLKFKSGTNKKNCCDSNCPFNDTHRESNFHIRNTGEITKRVGNT
jgi:hypothetical protein